MTEKNIKVFNRSGNSFGIVAANGISYNIKADSFILLTQDDIQFISASSEAFSKGYLFVDDTEKEKLEEEGILPDTKNYVDDDELKAILKGGKRADFDAFIGQFDETDILMRDRIIKAANSADIPSSRAKFIEASFGISLEDFAK